MADHSTYSDLSPSQHEFVRRALEQGGALGANPADEQSISDLFDSALDAVRRERQPPDIANMIVNVVGVLIGEALRDGAGLQWAVYTDEHGTDLCLRYEETSWTLFPLSSVAKRWEAQETQWVRPYLAWARDAVSGPPT